MELSPDQEATISSVASELYDRCPEFAAQIAPVYKALDWRWGEDTEPPSADRIASEARRLVRAVAEAVVISRPGVSIGCGGLRVNSYVDELMTMTLTLTFEHQIFAIADWPEGK